MSEEFQKLVNEIIENSRATYVQKYFETHYDQIKKSSLACATVISRGRKITEKGRGD